MALLIKINPAAYKERIQLQKANLAHSLVFNPDQKQTVGLIYNELIEICDRELTNDINVIVEPAL